jgi:hypothetical protein
MSLRVPKRKPIFLPLAALVGTIVVATAALGQVPGDAAVCADWERPNPILGVTDLWMKVGFFVVTVALGHVLIAFAYFGARLRNGGEPLEAFATSVGTTSLWAALMAWVAFMEYTWPDDWCSAEVFLHEAPLVDQVAASGWLVWVIVLIAAAATFVTLKTTFRRRVD